MERSLKDGSWGLYHGPDTRLLVERLAAYHQVEFVELCCSGTFAIELALRSLQVGTGDEVIMAGYDFIGNFNDIVAVGARPVLIDLDPHNWNLDPELIAAAIGTNTRAILISHLHGGVVPMARVMEIARQHGLPVIEDACQMPGATIHGRLAGTWGDIGVLSFGGSKLLSAGRGGAMVTNREDVWQRAKIFGERGNQAFPLSELQAAVLIPQLQKLGDRNAHRLRSVERLLSRMESITAFHPVRFEPQNGLPSFYKIAWRFVSGDCGDWSRERVIAAVQAEGIALDAGFRGFVQRGNRCRRVG